jgi:hypothetical protein
VSLVDDEDYDRMVAVGSWSADTSSHTTYAQNSSDNRTSRMHRIILDAQPGQDVDHINHNGLDNRKANLRLCSRSQNLANQRGRGGASRFKGVWWDKVHRCWQAQVGKLHLGLFKSEEDAARAYDAAAVDRWGEFAWTNFPTDI